MLLHQPTKITIYFFMLFFNGSFLVFLIRYFRPAFHTAIFSVAHTPLLQKYVHKIRTRMKIFFALLYSALYIQVS